MSDPTPTDEQLRELLAEARLDEPMPADVVARLDGVLADLGAGGESTPTPLPDRAAARRRRRRSLVLAAAAVVAIGVGGTQVDLSGGTGADSGVAARDSGGDAGAESQAEPRTESTAPGPDADSPAATALAAGPVVLHPDTFVRDVRRSLAPSDVGAWNLDRQTNDDRAARSGPGTMMESYAARCGRVDAGRGRQLPAQYDGEPAILVLRPAEAGVRQVDLYLCGAEEALRSTSVPAR